MSNVTLTPSVAAALLAGAAAGNYPSSAFLFVTEFPSPLGNGPAGPSYPLAPSLADQVVAFGAISAQSRPFSPATRLIRVHSTAVAAVKIGGAAPVAVAGGIGGTARMTAGETEFYAVNPGDSIAAIAST